MVVMEIKAERLLLVLNEFQSGGRGGGEGSGHQSQQLGVDDGPEDV